MLVRGLELATKLGRIPPGALQTCEDLFVLRHHLFAMLFDITDGRVDLPRAKFKEGSDLVSVPAYFVIIQNIENGDP